MEEERLVRHEDWLRGAVHTLPRIVVHVYHQLLVLDEPFASAEPPAAHVNVNSAVVGSVRGGAAQHERVDEAALARALVAEQHHLGEVAQCRPLGQIA